MTRALLFALLSAAACGDPVISAWLVHPPAGRTPERILPDVHSALVTENSVTVRSSGVSLKYLGPLQLAPLPSESVRDFEFHIPIHPEPEHGRHARVPQDVIGAFLNGLPIYNHFAALSWNGASLWHYDLVAQVDDGTLTVAGHPKPDLTHPAGAGLLEQLVQDASRHSPLIGFALDGFPVNGPWGYANGEGHALRRMRSSYRLRRVEARHDWPDGTSLTPEQYGPDVGADNPPGTFAEDYEYVPGWGDLDEFNGRFAKTPEYPNGTYAYCLTTDSKGRLAFPYLVGPRYYGRVAERSQRVWHPVGKKRISLSAGDREIKAGQPVQFRLFAPNAQGEPIRDFEYVHEQPIHLLIASADLAEFDHIHPQLAADDSYQVTYTFAHGGRYRVWADYSLPGEPPRVDEFDIDVTGLARPAQNLATTPGLLRTEAGLTVHVIPAKPVRAGTDIPIDLHLSAGRYA